MERCDIELVHGPNPDDTGSLVLEDVKLNGESLPNVFRAEVKAEANKAQLLVLTIVPTSINTSTKEGN